MKIYGIRHSSGYYEDAQEWIEVAFIDKIKAEEYRDDYNKNLEIAQEKQLKESSEFVSTCNDGKCIKCRLDKCLGRYDFDRVLDEEHNCHIIEIELIE